MNTLFIKNSLSKFGIDGAVFFTVLSRVVQAGGGIVTMFLITHFMSKEMQGYYYTFASVLAIQIFFELGLGGIIIQFVAHEMANLSITEDNRITGEMVNISRLSSIVHFCVKWYSILAIILFFILYFAGFFFFSNYGEATVVVNWKQPWLLICIATSLNLLLSPWIAILQGMNKVKEIARILFFQQAFTLFITWCSLAFDAGLYLSAINSFSAFFLIVSSLLIFRYSKLLLNIYKSIGLQKINYVKEIFPLQWKIALSWVSGYFIFQIFNPVLFAFHGSAIAGKMGITLTLVSAITGLVLSWTSTKVPAWSSFVARREYKQLDKSLKQTIKHSSLICFLCIGMTFALLGIFHFFNMSISERFLPLHLCLLLLLTIPLNNIINSWAGYLRSHKKEPYLFLSLTVGSLCAISTFLNGKYFTVDAVVVGYCCIICFVSFPLSYLIFKNKRNEYHG
jgi:O-antigen/teichoic acid export membrane protein